MLTSLAFWSARGTQEFGDYRSNALMALAKTRKMNPRQLATDVVAKLDLSDVCEKVESRTF